MGIVVTLLIGLVAGSSGVPLGQLGPALIHATSPDLEFLVYGIRLPRMLVAFSTGALLSLAGYLLQTATKNDLADPGILGVQSGAGAAVAIYATFVPISAGALSYQLPLAALCGSGVAVLLMYGLARTRSGVDPMRALLIGFGLSMVGSGGMVVIMSYASPDEVNLITAWLSGDIFGTTWPFAAFLTSVLLAGLICLYFLSRELDLLALDDHAAQSLGLHVSWFRALFLALSIVFAASAVCAAGAIAFVGLLGPHLAKALRGPRAEDSLAFAALGGGWMLLVCDMIAHAFGLPAGVLTGAIGAPYLLWRLTRSG